MVVSFFLAKAVGIWMLVTGSALIFNTKTIEDLGEEFTDKKLSLFSLFLGGIFALILGILLILTHNIWVFGWPLIITLIGWASFLKGVFFIVFTDYLKNFTKWYFKHVSFRIFGGVYLAFGLFLCWKGFAHLHKPSELVLIH